LLTFDSGEDESDLAAKNFARDFGADLLLLARKKSNGIKCVIKFLPGKRSDEIDREFGDHTRN
jgi:hypothetical protein